MTMRKIAALVLVLALAVTLYAVWGLQKEYSAAREQSDTRLGQLQELTDRAEQLQDTLEGLTLDNAQAQQAQAEELMRQADELKVQMQTLRTEMDTLRSYLEENRDMAAQAEEELTYLQGVYDALEEGLKEVERYIAGD